MLCAPGLLFGENETAADGSSFTVATAARLEVPLCCVSVAGAPPCRQSCVPAQAPTSFTIEQICANDLSNRLQTNRRKPTASQPNTRRLSRHTNASETARDSVRGSSSRGARQLFAPPCLQSAIGRRARNHCCFRGSVFLRCFSHSYLIQPTSVQAWTKCECECFGTSLA